MVDGSAQLYPRDGRDFGEESSFSLAADQLKVGVHEISLVVKDSEGLVSEPATATLEVRPGLSTHVTISSPTTAAPVLLNPGGGFNVSFAWVLTGIAGFDPTGGFDIQVSYEGTSGGWNHLKKTTGYTAPQGSESWAGLSTPTGDYTGKRDLRVAVLRPGTAEIVAQSIMADAIEFTTTRQPDVQLTISPGLNHVQQGQTASYTIHSVVSGGFSSPLSLSVSGLPETVGRSFSQNPVSAGGESTLQLTVPSNESVGTYLFTVQGTGGGRTLSVPATLMIGSGSDINLRYFQPESFPGDELPIQITYRIEGPIQQYWTRDWAYSLDGSTWNTIAASEIIGAGPVSGPGTFSLVWNAGLGINNLRGFQGCFSFRMRICTNASGLVEGTMYSTPVSWIKGLTAKGSRLVVQYYVSGVGSFCLEMTLSGNAFSSAAGPYQMPSSTDSIAYDGDKMWAITIPSIHRLNASWQSEQAYTFFGGEADGATWANIDRNGTRLWLATPNGIQRTTMETTRFRILDPSYYGARSFTGITFDGQHVWATSAKNIVKLRWTLSETLEVVAGGDIPLDDLLGSYPGLTDIAYWNGSLWVSFDSASANTIMSIVPPVFSPDIDHCTYCVDFNEPPAVELLSGLAGALPGDISVSYQCSDAENDTLRIEMEYSTDSGQTWSACALSGAVSGITSGGYSGSCTWQSPLNLPSFSGPVRLRARCADNDWGASSAPIEVSVQNTPPPPPRHPETPTNIYPFFGQTLDLTTPWLFASEFADPDADSTFAKSQFQVREKESDYSTPFWDSGEITPGTSVAQVPQSLDAGGQYWWRVRYCDDTDDTGLWSAWSAETAFTLASPTYTISGRVTLDGAGLPGVVLNGLPGNPVTDEQGAYIATVDQGWSDTVTPTLACYTFTPPSATYANVTSNQTQDYAAIHVPAITAQPQSVTVNPGQAVSFTVVATSTLPLSYQWKKDGSAISGATLATYSIASAQQTHEGSYLCAVTNAAGTTPSDAATLTVTDPPAITAQPQSKTVNPGQAVSFTVAATSTLPLSYQWKKDGSAISGATLATYSIASAQQTHEGSYLCEVKNAAGTTPSDAATLTVRDTEKPVITLRGDPVVTIEVKTPYTDAGATATDNYDGDLTAKIVVGNHVDTSKTGDYTVTYDVSDAAGNAATQVVRTVKVLDGGEGEGEGEGSLQVFIEPEAARTAGAQWQVDGGVWLACQGSAEEWHESGFTVEHLTVGEHTVSFKRIGPGWVNCLGVPGHWTAPEDKVVSIETGKTTIITGTYTEAKEGLLEKLLRLPHGDSLLFGLLATGLLVSDNRVRKRLQMR